MAIHHDLPIYRKSYELLVLTTKLVKGFPRDIKMSIGLAIQEGTVNIAILVAKANAARDKVPHLDVLLERLLEVELLLQLSSDLHLISLAQFASSADLTSAIGKQANGWRKSQTPAA